MGRLVGLGFKPMVSSIRLLARMPLSTSNRFTSLRVRVLSSFSSLLLSPKTLGLDLRFWQELVELPMRSLRRRS
jgi:hypothetical protein